MAISFLSIPSNIRVPFVAVEVNSSKASQGPALLVYRALIIAQKLAAGTGVADTAVRCSSVDQAITLGGRGSMAHRMARAWFASNTSTDMFLGLVADNGAGVAATGAIVVTGTATAAGTISLYLGGDLLSIGVASGDTAATVAASINTAINAALDLPVTSTVSTGTVTVLFRHKGLVGNSFDMRVNYVDGQALPAGISLAFTAVGAAIPGTTAPSLTNLIAQIADIQFEVVAHPYTDATTLGVIEAEMLSRFGPMRAIDGVAITSASGTLSTLTTLGAGRNSPLSMIYAQPGVTPLTPPMEFAAETAALTAFNAAIDPARPLQTLALKNAKPPAETDQFDSTERNTMLFSGIATSRRQAGGIVAIDRAITTYQTSPSGATDVAYLDVTTPLTLLYLRFAFRSSWSNTYPRHKLADDGTQFGSGQAVVTPADGKAFAVGWFIEMELLGLVEDRAQFINDLVVERDTTDRNRLNFLLPPNLINQLVDTAAQIQFRL